MCRCLPGILLNAVYGRGAGGAVIHDEGLSSVVWIGGPVLRGAVRISIVGCRVKSIVVSLVSHGTALTGRPLQASHT